MSDRTPTHVVSACALIRNDLGEILMVRTVNRGWDVPGGQIEEGESLIDGLKREIFEESGVRAEIGRLAVVRSNLNRSIVIFGFEARYLEGELRPSDETPEVRWAMPNQALSMITHPAIKQSVRDILASERHVVYQAYNVHPYQLVETHLPY